MAATAKKTTTTVEKPKAVKKAIKETANKTTVGSLLKKAKKDDKDLQNRLKDFIGDVLGEMVGTFDELSPSKKWDLIIQLLPYATPKRQATDIANNGGEFDALGTQLSQLANGIIKE